LIDELSGVFIVFFVDTVVVGGVNVMDAIFLTLDIMSLEISGGLLISPMDAVFLTLDIMLLE
jgi:hypothetical protein